MPSGLDLKCPECGRELVEVAGSGNSSNFGVLAIALAGVIALVVGGWMFYRTVGPKEASSGSSSSSSASPKGSAAVGPMLRLHGSNTIGEQLAPALAEAYLRAAGAQNVKTIRGEAEESKVQGTLPGDSSPQIIEIKAHGSATAFKDLKSSSCDIGMSSRPVKADEIADLGDLTAASSEHVLGLDGVAVIVNRDNGRHRKPRGSGPDIHR